MAQEFVEEIQCDGCNKQKSDVGVIRFRDQFNKYLCSKCCHRAMGDYDKICCKCAKNNADGSFEMPRYQGKDMCTDCIQKEILKEERREAIKLRIKNFTKEHWKFLISTSIGVIFGIIALIRI